jgi:hypothetical protein
MKNTLIFAVLLCIFSLQANAQTEKGKIILGGYTSFSTHKLKGQSDQRINYFSTALRPAYFLSNNLAIGLGLLFNYNVTKHPSFKDGTEFQSKNTNRNYGLAPFARYYFNISEKFKIFNELSINGNIGDSKYVFAQDPVYNSAYKFKGFGAVAKPGLAFFPAKKFAIEFSFPMLSYQKSFTETKSERNFIDFKSNGDEFKIGIDTFKPEIGVNFHF